MVTFLDRTSPASSMAKPQAMKKTRKPATRNMKVVKMKPISPCNSDSTVIGSADWASAGAAAIATRAPMAVERVSFMRVTLVLSEILPDTRHSAS